MYAIETRKLTKYYGKARGIIDLNLEIEEGEVFGFIGPNGAGKSTTIRTLIGLIFPISGSAKVLGMDAVTETKEIKKQIGYMPSEIHYYCKMDVRELLSYSSRFYESGGASRIEELAKTFELDLERKIIDLSLGNQKKVAIIQSLVHHPRLLILDEPTSGLDPLMQAKFFSILKEENKRGTTVFFSSHTLSNVQKICRRVGIIKEGRIVAVEDIAGLRKKQLRKVQVEQKLLNKLSAAGTIDLETAVLIAKARMEGETEAEMDNVDRQLRKEKQYLFVEVSGTPAAKKTARAKERIEGSQTVLERAAKRAATTGSRTDLQEYLKLRRNFV